MNYNLLNTSSKTADGAVFPVGITSPRGWPAAHGLVVCCKWLLKALSSLL